MTEVGLGDKNKYQYRHFAQYYLTMMDSLNDEWPGTATLQQASQSIEVLRNNQKMILRGIKVLLEYSIRDEEVK